MGLTRSETTYLLSALLEKQVLHDRHWSREVPVRRGEHDIRGYVDYMSFRANSLSPSGIEHGDFTCYEVKSCLDDYNSGNGLNFVGDWNYIVTTIDTYKKIGQLPASIGCYVPVSVENYSSITIKPMFKEFENPPELTSEIDNWKLWRIVNPVERTQRFHSGSELLYGMLCARPSLVRL